MQIAKLALISVSSAYSTKAEPKKAAFLRLSMSAGAGLALAVDLLAFGETGRKAAFYCRFLFVPSLFLFSLRLSVSVCLCSWPTVPRFWLSGSGSISAALLVLAACCRSCLCCRRAGFGSSGVPLLALISGRLCRWCCLRVFSSASASDAGASSAPVLSGRVQAFPCPVLRLFWCWRWETMQAKRIWQNAQFCKAVFV